VPANDGPIHSHPAILLLVLCVGVDVDVMVNCSFSLPIRMSRVARHGTAPERLCCSLKASGDFGGGIVVVVEFGASGCACLKSTDYTVRTMHVESETRAQEARHDAHQNGKCDDDDDYDDESAISPHGSSRRSLLCARSLPRAECFLPQ